MQKYWFWNLKKMLEPLKKKCGPQKQNEKCLDHIKKNCGPPKKNVGPLKKKEILNRQQKKIIFLIPFIKFFSSSWKWWYYPHRSKDSVSLVCGIFYPSNLSQAYDRRHAGRENYMVLCHVLCSLMWFYGLRLWKLGLKHLHWNT